MVNPARFDVFLSHADADLARRVQAGLGQAGLSVWLDQRNLRGGAPLANRLMDALVASRNLAVLWSEAASRSKWVNTEWTSVVNLNHQPGTDAKGIVPCITDGTPLALFLLNYKYCDFRVSFESGMRDLIAALRGDLVPTPPPASPPRDFVAAVNEVQLRVLGALSTGDLERAAQTQAEANATIDAALAAQPDDFRALALAGYHCKNAYMIKHWSEIQAGRAPGDPFLDKAAQFFLRALGQKPDDPSALNGLGNVFFFGRDLDAAEFYVSRAVSRAREEGLDFAAAEHDLQLIKQLKVRPSG